MDNKLPALPGSDQKTLETNGFARDFWKGNQVTRIEDKEMEKCPHKFKSVQGGAECQKCHFGLLGQFEVRSGKLFFGGELVGL